MRICLIVPGFSSSESDWCIPALLDWVSRLASDAEPWVLALRYPFDAGSYSVFGAQVHALGFADRRGGARALLAGRAVAAVLGQHRREPFDVIHGLWADEAGFLATACGGLIRRPSVVSVMGGEPVWIADVGYGLLGNRVSRWVVRRSLRRAVEVTVGSAWLEPKVAAVSGRLGVHRLPLGVEVARFSVDGPVADLNGDPVLLNVASLTPVKDQRTLIRAFAIVSRRLPGAHLHIVGEGSLGPELEALAGECGVAKSVTLHGQVPHHDLPPLYRAADLNVVSSRFESQGMTVLEAAACGTATVGTAVGVLPELGDGVRTVPVGDAPALATELLAVIGGPSLVEAMGRSALRVVHERFTLDYCTRGFLDLYNHLVCGAFSEEPR